MTAWARHTRYWSWLLQLHQGRFLHRRSPLAVKRSRCPRLARVTGKDVLSSVALRAVHGRVALVSLVEAPFLLHPSPMQLQPCLYDRALRHHRTDGDENVLQSALWDEGWAARSHERQGGRHDREGPQKDCTSCKFMRRGHQEAAGRGVCHNAFSAKGGLVGGTREARGRNDRSLGDAPFGAEIVLYEGTVVLYLRIVVRVVRVVSCSCNCNESMRAHRVRDVTSPTLCTGWRLRRRTRAVAHH